MIHNRKKILTITVAVILGVSAYITGCGGPKTDEEETESTVEEVGIEFPYDVEGTDIIIKSLSQASIPNPDSDGSLTDDIACIEVENNSDTYISNVEFTLEMQDGTEFNFKIADMPTGTLVQAFDVNDTVYDGKTGCEEITADNLSEEDENQLMEEAVQIHVEETIVTLTNIADETLKNLSIVCHCDMDGSYFGGCSYTYNVENIPAGKSIDIDASDCYLGEASVVRIYQNN